MSTKESPLFDELQDYLQASETEMRRISGDKSIALFYDPIRYVLDLKGKRIRPLLALLSAEVSGGKALDARYVAAAVELLHNFTLVHDDIMDNDATRRGLPTVHVKWDVSTAILTGDGLMGLAFQKLLQSPLGDVAAMARRFTDTMIVICEGQALDKMFEVSGAVDSAAYLDMIARKTAVLIELSCELGAMSAAADEQTVLLLRKFGYALGMGFQIQDDLLDIMADEKALGKKVGSDLAMNKQTILTIKLRDKYPDQSWSDMGLAEFRELLGSSGVRDEVQQDIDSYFETVHECLQQLPAGTARERLSHLTDLVRQRRY